MAILPQVVMVYKAGVIAPIVTYYLLLKGAYRIFYILNWISRYHYEGKKKPQSY